MTEASDAILHILNKAPSHPRAAACLAQLAPGDTLVLLEDGVLGLLSPVFIRGLPATAALYALDVDAQARGLPDRVSSSAADGPEYQSCDMGQFVELTARHGRIINW